MIQFDPYCYDSVTFYRFPQEQSVLGDFLAFFFLSLRSNYGRKLYFYFYSFLWSLVCYVFQSIAISFAYRLVFLPTLLPCSSRFLCAFQKSRVQSRLLYFFSKLSFLIFRSCLYRLKKIVISLRIMTSFWFPLCACAVNHSLKTIVM